MPVKISSVTIAKNEAKNIARCIRSLEGVVDEIIVLIDNDTSDGTEEIISGFGFVKYEKTAWEGYSKTKLKAISIASNDWILWIDADEELTQSLRDEILELKKGTPSLNQYSIPRKAFFLGKWIRHSGWYPGRVVRLFNRNHSTLSENDVHEKLITNGATGKLKYDLNHFTDPSIEHYFSKFNLYTSLAAKELYAKNKRAGTGSVVLRSIIIFIKMYIVRRGFLDGLHGLILAVFSALYVFTKYAKLWEMNLEQSDKTNANQKTG